MLYDQAAAILDKLIAQKGTIKSLIMGQKQVDKKLLYALVCQSLKYKEPIEIVLEKSGISRHLKYKTSLLIVLVHDLLFGKLVNCKYKKEILKHKTRLNAELVKLKIKQKCKSNEDLIPESIRNSIELPRYVRVNTLKTTVDDTVRKDVHLKELLLLPPNTDLHDDEMLLNGSIILQDKASCFPAFCLSPPKNSIVIDACAAPGNKTSHLSSIMENTGKIYAFDKDKRRLETLEKLTQRAGCKNITPIHGSFLDADPNDSRFRKCEYILLDPSCSGSGIVGRMDHLLNNEIEQDLQQDRLESLAEFQKQAILHAFSFPNVKKVVYSTCSKHEIENELVVKACLENSEFELENTFVEWKTRGHDLLPNGDLI